MERTAFDVFVVVFVGGLATLTAAAAATAVLLLTADARARR